MANEENKDFWISLGNVIRRRRRLHGISQEQLALNTEIDRRYLSDVEQGKRNVSINVAAKLAAFFEMSLSELIAEVEREELPPFSNLDSLKDILSQLDYDESIVFENPDFLNAVIGTVPDGRVVYDFDLMVESLIADDGMSREDAIEFIDYNTLRALPYMGEKAPVILYRFR